MDACAWFFQLFTRNSHTQKSANDDSKLKQNKQKKKQKTKTKNEVRISQTCHFRYQKIQFNIGISYSLLLKLLNWNNSVYHIAFRYGDTQMSEPFLRLE